MTIETIVGEMFEIVYTEKREVSAEFIRTKYADAVDNGEVSGGLDNLADMMAELESQGFVTFITQRN